jgi:hypothetical protein
LSDQLTRGARKGALPLIASPDLVLFRAAHCLTVFHPLLCISVLAPISAKSNHRTGIVSTYNSSEDLLQQFVKSVDIPFDIVLKKISDHPPPKTQRERAQLAGDYLRGILANPNFAGLLPKQIMLVTTDDALLWAAKDVGFFTVKYRGVQGLYGQVSTDFIATSALEVQDALEELNGVALRTSAFSHRTSV